MLTSSMQIGSRCRITATVGQFITPDTPDHIRIVAISDLAVDHWEKHGTHGPYLWMLYVCGVLNPCYRAP